MIFTVLALISCGYKTDAEKERERLNGFNIIIVDSCEYLIKEETGGYQGYGYFAHKGNCRFCKERREREGK